MRGIQRRTKQVASNRAIAGEARKSEQMAACPKNGYEVPMFADASDNHWRRVLTQVPMAELEAGIEMENMSHKPFGF